MTYNRPVEKVLRVYHSFEEAERADLESYALMTPTERLNIVIELWNRRHPDAAQQRLARVYRIVELERR